MEETTRSDPLEGWDVNHFPCKRCLALDSERTAYHELHKDNQGRSDVHNHVWTATLVHRGNRPGG